MQNVLRTSIFKKIIKIHNLVYRAFGNSRVIVSIHVFEVTMDQKVCMNIRYNMHRFLDIYRVIIFDDEYKLLEN